MPWSKFDDAFWSHPKTLRAGNEAVGAFVRLVCYCSQYLTDGTVDADTALSIAGRPKVLDKLVSVGLLERDGDSFLVHDYLSHHPSRAQVEAQREAKTQRQSRWRENASAQPKTSRSAGNVHRVDASTAPSTDASQDASRDATRDDAPSHPIPSHPKEEELTSFVLREGASAPTDAPKGKRGKGKREPEADVPPPEGTTARRVYDAIVGDRELSGCARPGDFATRVCADGAYPGVDVLAEVRRAGVWAAGKPRSPWRNVRAGLLGWLRQASEGAQQAQQRQQTARVAQTPSRLPPMPANGLPAPGEIIPVGEVLQRWKAVQEAAKTQ